MEETLYEKLLSDGSFLLPEVDQSSISTVISSINEEQTHPLLAMIRELAALSYQIQTDYYHDPETTNIVFEINPDNVADLIAGFRTPIIVIYSCFSLRSPLFDRNSEPKISDPYIRVARNSTLGLFVNYNHKDLATIASKIFTYCEEYPFIDNEYYRIGVIASLTTFREFIIKITLNS